MKIPVKFASGQTYLYLNSIYSSKDDSSLESIKNDAADKGTMPGFNFVHITISYKLLACTFLL